jgi:ABC-type Mn2+/Zn2+ transport system permease subunit
MIDLLISPFADNAFMRHSLGAGLIVAAICAVVGTFVVLRGLSFVADALAHGVLPGIAIAVLAGLPAVLGAAVGAAIMMGGIGAITRRSRLSGDTAVGLLFAGMLALGVMITSRSRSFTGDLTRLLFGELLGVRPAEVAALGAVALAVGLIAYVCRRPFLLLSVDPDVAATSGFPVRRFENLLLGLVALAVVASFAVAGTLLVFGMLVAPAATGALVARRPATMMAVAGAVGGVSMYVGLLVSYHANLAAGASVVTVSVAAFLVTLVIRNWRWR